MPRTILKEPNVQPPVPEPLQEPQQPAVHQPAPPKSCISVPPEVANVLNKAKELMDFASDEEERRLILEFMRKKLRAVLEQVSLEEYLPLKLLMEALR